VKYRRNRSCYGFRVGRRTISLMKLFGSWVTIRLGTPPDSADSGGERRGVCLFQYHVILNKIEVSRIRVRPLGAIARTDR